MCLEFVFNVGGPDLQHDRIYVSYFSQSNKLYNEIEIFRSHKFISISHDRPYLFMCDSINLYTRCTRCTLRKYIIFFDILLYFCIVLVLSRFCITFFRDLNAMRIKNCRLYFFRVSNESSLPNATQNDGIRIKYYRNSTLLKLFQGCIRERESYPKIKLSCTGYGKLFKIFLPLFPPPSTPSSRFARSKNLLLKFFGEFFATRDRSIFLQFAAADIPFTETRE